MIIGTGEFLRRSVDGEISTLSVWDGRKGKGAGGTQDAVRRALESGWPVTRIDPCSAVVEPVTLAPATSKEFLDANAQLKVILFGDFVGFSKLDSAGLRNFHAHVLPTVGRCIDAIPQQESPCARNTWGDALYLAFSSIVAAARFSLDLQAALARLGEEQSGIAGLASLRLALHYGPTFEVIDPVTKQATVVGTHVSRAARLEPATAPGEVYASEAFAARLMLERNSGFDCQYLKNLPWAKNYGVFPTFRLVRMGGETC
jgi:class 3 adenylate cyclase